MEWIIIFLTILAIGYFVYTALQNRNDIDQQRLELEQKQLELNPEYRQQKTKEQWNATVTTGEKQLEEAELKLKDAQEHGDKELIKEAKNSVAYSQDWLKIFKAARRKGLSGVK